MISKHKEIGPFAVSLLYQKGVGKKFGLTLFPCGTAWFFISAWFFGAWILVTGKHWGRFIG